VVDVMLVSSTELKFIRDRALHGFDIPEKEFKRRARKSCHKKVKQRGGEKGVSEMKGEEKIVGKEGNFERSKN